MRVGLMADTHDRLPAIAELLERLRVEGREHGDARGRLLLAVLRSRRSRIATCRSPACSAGTTATAKGLSAYAARGMGTELYESPHSFEVAGKRILSCTTSAT